MFSTCVEHIKERGYPIMKKTTKRILALLLAVALVASLAGCAKMNYVTKGTIQAIREVKSGEWQNAGEEEAGELNDESVLETPFTAGTYGGVEFGSVEDVVNYFVEAYDYTKTLTAEYVDENGQTQTYYKLLGDENINIGDVMIDGKANATINGIVPGIVGGLFAPNTYGLMPCYNRDPNMDNNFDDNTKKSDHDFRTSALTADDVLDASVTDNGDGKITIVIQPKMAEMSLRGEDSQGRFFEVLGDISGVVGQISVISFTQGEATDNVKVTYIGGTGTFVIDTATKEITEADYNMVANVSVTHANVAIIRDKSANLAITYTNHYPATDDYLKEKKGITRK